MTCSTEAAGRTPSGNSPNHQHPTVRAAAGGGGGARSGRLAVLHRDRSPGAGGRAADAELDAHSHWCGRNLHLQLICGSKPMKIGWSWCRHRSGCLGADVLLMQCWARFCTGNWVFVQRPTYKRVLPKQNRTVHAGPSWNACGFFSSSRQTLGSVVPSRDFEAIELQF